MSLFIPMPELEDDEHWQGYQDGRMGQPLPGGNRSLRYVHSYYRGMDDLRCSKSFCKFPRLTAAEARAQLARIDLSERGIVPMKTEDVQ